MSARPKVALVLVLLLLVGFAGIFLWSGFGTGEGLSEGDPATVARAAGNTDRGAETLTTGAGAEREPVGEDRRENMETRPGTGATPRVELCGRLVRSEGTPAPGVMLRFAQIDERLLIGGRRALDPRDALACRTDRDGRFRVKARPDSVGALRLDGTESVFEHGTGQGMVVRIGKVSKDLGDVVIRTAARVSGQVVDEAGGPVAGVSVSSTNGVSLWNLALGEGNKTGKDGRFELEGLRPGKQTLLTRSPEHLPAEHELELAEGQHRRGILIRVRPGGFILGTVVDDLGRPVANAEVAASRTRQVDAQIKITAFAPGESTRTDQAGRFRLANLDTEKTQLRVSKNGLDTRTVPDVVVGTVDLVVELERLGAIEGVLVDEDHRPVQGGVVSASRGGGTLRMGELPADLRGSGTVTSAVGEFRLEDVPPGRVLVTARSETHLPARQRVQVRPGETTKGLRLVTTPATTLEVTVEDAAGQPVSNARVTVREKDRSGAIRIPAGDRSRGVRRVKYRADVDVRRTRNGPPLLQGGGGTLGEGKTDARGKVTIGGLPAGEVLVGARHDELALVTPQELLLPERGKATTRLHMRRGGFLLVSAVDTAGEPVAHAKFRVTPVTTGDEDEHEGQEGTCDGEGKTRVGPLPAGDYTATLLGEQRPHVRGGMSFTWKGSEPVLDDSRVRVQIREGDTKEVVLRKPFLTTVRGSVRDRSGPVKGAQVALLQEGAIRMPFGSDLEAFTDGDGLFEITNVPSGKYTLSWGRRSAVVPSEDEIQVQKDQMELVRHLVIPGAVVKLLTRDEEGERAVGNAEVTLSRVSGGTAGQGPRRQTRFRMISITNRGSGPQKLDMSAGARSARTDEDGRAVIKDVPPGKYALSIKHPRFATHREEIEILADATLDLGTRKMASGGSVSGRILFEDDQIQMVLVQLTTWDGKNTERTVAIGGRFRFSGLASGKYKVRAQRIGGDPGAPWGPEETVEVKPGGTARTQLRLPY